jgi:transcriptional regulator with XRE-family HTH domain
MEAHLTPAQYRAARTALGWTHSKIARVIGVHKRTTLRYQAGKTEIPEPAARLLVRLRLTVSTRLGPAVIYR